jgi:Amiloride-sensitive sodium channel
MYWFHDSRVSWTMVQTKVSYKRELIHDFISALVSTGANLSLFVGVSALTFVEVIFFVYLRVKQWIKNVLA